MTSSLRPTVRAMSATVKKPGLAVSPRSIFLTVAYATPLRAASSCWDRPRRLRVLRMASSERPGSANEVQIGARNGRLRYEGSKEEGYTQELRGFLDARRGPEGNEG